MLQGTTSFARLEGDGGAAVAETVRETLRRLRAGEPLRAGKLTLIPLLPVEGDESHATGYLPLETAVAQRVMSVTEKPAATVPELVVSSTAEAPVLMICGEQVIGGLQNRVFNTTMLVAAHTTLDVPVTCVEMGRWHGAGGFGYGRMRGGAAQPGDAPERLFSSAEPAYARMRAKHTSYVTKSLASGGGYRSDQSEVWDEVSERLMATGVNSGTSAMRAMYEAPERSSRMDETVAQVSRPEGALGFVAVIDGKPVGGEVFGDDALAAAYWPRLTRSYAMDALDNVWSGQGPVAEQETDAAAAIDPVVVEADFLAGARAAEIQAYTSPGLGSDVRVTGAKLSGAGLVHDGALVHLSLFPEEEG